MILSYFRTSSLLYQINNRPYQRLYERHQLDTGTVDADHNFTYNAFGDLQDDPEPTSLGTKYLYIGQYFDAINTELYNLRARQYDPSNGRFLSRDKWAYSYENPVELNRYVYTANNSATYFDPSGYSLVETGANFLDDWAAYKTTGRLKEYGWGGIASAFLGNLIGMGLVVIGETIAYYLSETLENFDFNNPISSLSPPSRDEVWSFLSNNLKRFWNGKVLLGIGIDMILGFANGAANSYLGYRKDRVQTRRLDQVIKAMDWQSRKVFTRFREKGIITRSSHIIDNAYSIASSLITVMTNLASSSGILGLVIDNPDNLIKWADSEIRRFEMKMSGVGSFGAVALTYAVNAVFDSVVRTELTLPGGIRLQGDIIGDALINGAFLAHSTLSGDYANEQTVCERFCQ